MPSCFGGKRKSSRDDANRTPESSDSEMSDLSDHPSPTLASIPGVESRRGIPVQWTDESPVPTSVTPRSDGTVSAAITPEIVLSGVPDELLPQSVCCCSAEGDVEDANETNSYVNPEDRPDWYRESVRLEAEFRTERGAAPMREIPLPPLPEVSTPAAARLAECSRFRDQEEKDSNNTKISGKGKTLNDASDDEASSDHRVATTAARMCLGRSAPVSSRCRMLAVWYALGPHKWREVVDGRHAGPGPLVYDQCLHGANFGHPEPGFAASMARAWDFVGRHCLGRVTTLDMWLHAHALAMGHVTAYDSRVPGKLRRSHEQNFIMVPGSWPGHDTGIDQVTWSEISSLRPRVCELQPSSTDPSGHHLVFLALKRKRRRRYFAHFVSRFYDAVSRAADDVPEVPEVPEETAQQQQQQQQQQQSDSNDTYKDAQRARQQRIALNLVTLCGSLQQTMQRSEPAKDGNQRVSVLFLCKHLVECGLTPTALWWPNGADITSRAEWTRHIVLGLRAWREVLEAHHHGKEE